MLAATTFFTDAEPYGSWWFATMWGVEAAALIAAIAATRMWRRIGSMMLHSALLLILAGGALTACMGERGSVTIPPGGVEATVWLTDDGAIPRPMPVAMSLDSFVVSTHRGMTTPAGYTSYLTLADSSKATVEVNKPLTIGTYRFYQASYTADGATILGVNHDPGCGMAVSYAAYILLGIGMILVMANPRGRFRRALRSVGATGALMLLTALPSWAAPRAVAQADMAMTDTLQVIYQGRVAPFSTPATELLRTLADRTTLGGMSAERIAASIMLYPADWGRVALIRVKSRELRDSLGMSGSMIAPDSLYNSDGSYRLASLYKGTGKGLDREIIDVDARLAAFRSAADGTLCLPMTASSSRLPRWRVAAERFFYKVPMGKVAFMAILSLGIMALLSATTGRLRPLRLFIAPGIIIALAWQSALFGLRWIIGRTVPMTNGGEATAVTSLILLIIALGLSLRRRWLLSALIILMGGFAALVSWLGTPAAGLSPVMPVLSSPWLSIHVGIIMTAYALLAATFGVSAVSVVRPSAYLKELNITLLYPALLLLAAGIFTGAVWAGESWGRYWAWDPKETWALITLMVYCIPLHIAMSPRRLAIFLLAAFATVVMTYWGVNHLPSLHAYS